MVVDWVQFCLIIKKKKKTSRIWDAVIKDGRKAQTVLWREGAAWQEGWFANKGSQENVGAGGGGGGKDVKGAF